MEQYIYYKLAYEVDFAQFAQSRKHVTIKSDM